MTTTSLVFDDIVIGSSPLMLLQAQKLAQAGRRVCVVERSPRLGGAWQTAQVDGGIEVEIASHVIEVFPHIYDVLSRAAGVPFVPLEAQPIRIHPTGLRVAYFSRILLLASGTRLFVGLIKARLQTLMNRGGDRDRLLNFQFKFRSFLHYQAVALFSKPIMQGPADGFVDFMTSFTTRCQDMGIVFQTTDIQNATRQPDGIWQLGTDTGQNLYAACVHCTTSTNLRRKDAQSFAATPVSYAHRWAVIVDVPKADVQISQTYVAFWKDPDIARISRIDRTDKTLDAERFLIEFHSGLPKDAETQTAMLRARLERARIIKADGSFTTIGTVDCLFTKNVDQLPQGEIAPGFFGYFSSGNLAAGIAAWRRQSI